jgi:hypothetical protein
MKKSLALWIYAMTTIDEIKAAIDHLPLCERAEVARWLHGWGDDAWDQQMQRDAKSGKLDALLKQVDADISSNRLEDMP